MPFWISILSLISLSLGNSLFASMESAEKILVHSIWAISTQATMEENSGEVYLQIENHTANPITLTTITSPIAEGAEIRDTNQNKVEKLEILAGESLSLSPEDYRITLVNLVEDWEEQAVFALTLLFDAGDHKTIEIPIAATISTTSPEASPFIIYDTWARFAFSGSTGAVYMTLENRGEEADQLVGITTSAAEVVEIHQSTMTDDMMSMSPIDALEIAANGDPILLNGDPYHVMLIDLREDLMIGQAITLMLEFASGETITIAAPVLLEAPLPTPAEEQHH